MNLIKKIFLSFLALIFTFSLVVALKLILVDGLVREEKKSATIEGENKALGEKDNTNKEIVETTEEKNDYIAKSIEEIEDTGFLLLVNHSNKTGEISRSKLKVTDNGLYYVRDDIYEDLMKFMEKMDNLGYPIFVNSAFRTIDEQKAIYENAQGDKKWYARAGESEHHTGLAIDLIAMAEIDGNEEASNETYNLMKEYCQDYGFILRYPKGKEHLTEIDYEYWHFRYVGFPHAKYIKDHDLVFEEYIDLLHNEEYIEVEADKRYRIYAVEAKDGYIPVPKENSYLVSQDNTGYYIVTEVLP